MEIHYVNIPCEFCGTEHPEMVIDGHISQPHICEKCWRDVVREYLANRSQCFDCSHCRFNVDYGVYICYKEDVGTSIPDVIFCNEQICPDKEERLEC